MQGKCLHLHTNSLVPNIHVSGGLFSVARGSYLGMPRDQNSGQQHRRKAFDGLSPVRVPKPAL